MNLAGELEKRNAHAIEAQIFRVTHNDQSMMGKERKKRREKY